MKLKTIILPALLCIIMLCSCEPSLSKTLIPGNGSSSTPIENTDGTKESQIGIRGIYEIKKTYSYDGEEKSIEEIAVILYEQLLTDMMVEDDMRDFKIIEYDNINLDIISFDQNEPGHPYSENLY